MKGYLYLQDRLSAKITLVNLLKILSRSEKSTGKAALILMSSLLLANLLGVLKLRLFAQLFGGASGDLGLFLAADRIPNFLFNVLAFGALSSSFIPVFSRAVVDGRQEKAFDLANSLFNLAMIIFLGVGAIFLFFADPILGLFAWGKPLSGLEHGLLKQNYQILFLAQIFFLFSAFSSGILQSLGRFFNLALSPVIFNLTVILVTILGASRWGIIAAAYGTLLGAFFHFAVQLPALISLGYRYRPRFHFKEKMFGEVTLLFLPRTLSLVADQLGIVFLTSLALSLSAASVVVFSFAQRLALIPVTLFGATLAQASFAKLSQSAHLSSDDFLGVFRKTFYLISFLILPAAAFLLALRLPLTRIFFGARGFDWTATLLTAETLSFLAVGLFAQAQAGFLARSFFALKDTRTPLLSSLTALGLGGVYALGVGRWGPPGVAGLAQAAVIIYLADFLFLIFALGRRFRSLLTVTFWKPVFLMGVSAVLAGGLAYLSVRLLDLSRPVFDTRFLPNLIFLTGLALALGEILYLCLTYLLGVVEVKKILSFLFRFKTLGPAFWRGLFPE